MFASNNIFLTGSGSSGYQISRSVRFRASATAYFNRTYGVATNNQKGTISVWLKQGLLNQRNTIFANSAGSIGVLIGATAGACNLQLLGSGLAGNGTTQVFRDPGAWFHLVIAVDTTQATGSNRIKAYINNTAITLPDTATQNAAFFTDSIVYRIGNYANSSGFYYDGYMAEFYFVDGQQLTPSSFGATDASTGVWNPIAYTGTYGNNGFYLNFSDNSAATAAAIGKDSSGNGNNWTPTNISVTAGTTYDSMVDTPTNYGTDTGLGGEVRGNYPTWNPLQLTTNGGTQATLSNANLTAAFTAGDYCYVPTTLGANDTSPMYCEFYINNIGAYSYGIGFLSGQVGTFSISGIWRSDGDAAQGISGQTFTTGDLIGIAISGGTATAYKNGSLVGSISAAAFVRYIVVVLQGNGASVTANFGQRPFAYTAPSGYKALCSTTLPVPTISNGANYFAATTYAGSSGTQSISNAINGVSFQPDFVWLKNRTDGSTSHSLYNSVVGIAYYLQSNTTDSEFGNNGLSGFNNNGFGLVSNNSWVNLSGKNYIGWQWKGGGTAVTNTAGSITSSVSANPTAGFSVLTYTGTIANATVGHGLGVAPQMIIARNRTNVVNWIVYHASLTSASYYLTLDETNGQTSNSIFWQGVAPTSTVFSLGANSSCNGSTSNVAYCFAPIAGYSAFGSYTGNGSADGPFIYTGFLPRWVMIKRTDSTSSWVVIDTSRQTYNVQGPYLVPNTSDAETTGTTVLDVVSNGFKSRSASSANASGGTYIYAAFAENPFKIARAR